MVLEVMRTDTRVFRELIESGRNRREDWFHAQAGHIELCNVPIPVRLKSAERVRKGQRINEGRNEFMLGVLQAELDPVKRLQPETAAELDALLPAILEPAFKGKL
jgi:hypothetical protein